MTEPSLTTLKKMLMEEKQLAKVWGYFMDHFAESSEFIALGERVEHDLLEVVIDQVARQMFPTNHRISGLLLTTIAEDSFIHGAYFAGPHPGGIIYFEDIPMGLVMGCELPPSHEVKYARFSPKPLRGPIEPSLN